MDNYILEIDPDPQLVPTARMFAATIARQLGCAEDSVLDVKIAISEACTNAVQAHQERGLAEPIRLRVEEQDDGVVYEVEDVGPGIDVRPEEPPTVFRRAIEDSEPQQGMGVALIRALFPSVEFGTAGGGTRVRFQLAR
jgi:serine/threonine-protein kinase RsbW